MVMAPKGHFRTQIPHPTHRFSVIMGLLSTKTMVSSPVRTGGQSIRTPWNTSEAGTCLYLLPLFSWPPP